MINYRTPQVTPLVKAARCYSKRTQTVFVCDLREPVALSVARARHRPVKISNSPFQQRIPKTWIQHAAAHRRYEGAEP
jgi:hypothetical protein